MPANDRRGGRPLQGQCHRKQTAGASAPARVKRCGKSAPRLQQWRRHGKPHREQGLIGVLASRFRPQAQGFPPRNPGWPREAGREARPRGMVIQVALGRPFAAGQNPAYRPPGTSPFVCGGRYCGAWALAVWEAPRDRWPSGRRRAPGKCVYARAYRGFESHPVRQFGTKLAPRSAVFPPHLHRSASVAGRTSIP